MHATHTATRERLYDEVWTNPVRTVAAKYGISDVGLAKVLRRHRIPVPGRGYWQILRAGSNPRRRPLPPLRAGEEEQVAIYGRSANSPLMSSDGAGGRPQPERIDVPADLSNPHPLVAQADKSLRHSKADQQGILQARSKHRLDLRVTLGTLDRALRLLDGLVRALEVRGMPVSVATGDATATSTVVDGEPITFFLEERIEQVELPPTPQERLQRWGYSRRYDHIATAELRLRLVGLARLGVRQTWSDGKRQRLEGSLGSFLLGLQSAASALQRQRAEREEWRRKYELERQRRIEAELARQLEETRARELQRQVALWQQARLIRDYLEAAKAAGVVFLPADVKMATLDEWTRWAGAHAERVNPLHRASPVGEQG
jgi:hypothetical protein